VELTTRDCRLIEDIALHHLMTREQIVTLGYFTSISRANRRLLTLVKSGYLERIRVNSAAEPRKALYRASQTASAAIDPRVTALLSSRRVSAMQLDHSLAVVDARIKLKTLGMDRWLAEPQCRHQYTVSQGLRRVSEDVRPDGVARFGDRLLFVEVDRGNVSLSRIKAKLQAYATYQRSGMLNETYGPIDPAILIITTATLRKRNIAGVIPHNVPFPIYVHTVTGFRACTTLSEVAR
jgi:hypothetical protein